MTLDHLTGRFDEVTVRLDHVTGELTLVTGGLEHVTSRVDQLTDRVDQLTDKVEHLSGTVDHLAAMVATSFQSLLDEMRDGFRMTAGRFDRIERKLDTTIERVNNHDVRLGRLETGNA